MAALNPQPSRKPSPIYKEALKIKGQIDKIVQKMHQNRAYMPTRGELEEQAERLIDFINQHHAKTAPHESYLKAAIIDLTEVPVMSEEMQRIAFHTALKDASRQLDLFLACC